MFLAALGVRAQDKTHFSLSTDRDLYTSGETILFKIYLPGADQSVVIKTDLLNAKGKIVEEVSKNIKNQEADGFLYLTDSLKTGTYLLCTSTGENREIAVKELFICNRFIGLSETASLLRATGQEAASEKSSDSIVVDGLNKTCKVREKLKVSIHLPSELFAQSKSNLLVSVAEVIPEYTTKPFLRKGRTGTSKFNEKEGLVVEGYATDLRNGAPFENGCIFLSVADSIPGLDYFITGKNGYFNFQLKDYFGKIPAVVQGYDLGKKLLLKLSINHPDSLNEAVPAFEFTGVPQELQSRAGEAMEATLLGKAFNFQPLSIGNSSINRKFNYPFYGVPTEVVYPGLFIDLPDFTEISRELLTSVKFRAYNRIPTLHMLNPVTQNNFNDQPLVTLDGVPVRDLNVIKNLGSKQISRIEISRKERFYGDLAFPGVVAIYTPKADNKLLPVSDDLIKLTLDAVQPDASLNVPRNQKMNEPDLRKVLLWNPAVKPEKIVRLDFETSDIQGHYKLVIKGKTGDGSILSKELYFDVK